METTETTKLKWYALNVMPNQEKSIKKNILREIERNNLGNAISSVEIPIEKILTFKNGKKSVKEKITMPGYILIEADLNNGEVLPIVKNTQGVFGFITDGRVKNENSRPQPLRKSEVERILNIEEKDDDELLWKFEIGNRVKILQGPFSTFEGVITSLNEDKQKMNVNVIIFGRETPVELDYTHVDKVFEKNNKQ